MAPLLQSPNEALHLMRMNSQFTSSCYFKLRENNKQKSSVTSQYAFFVNTFRKKKKKRNNKTKQKIFRLQNISKYICHCCCLNIITKFQTINTYIFSDKVLHHKKKKMKSQGFPHETKVMLIYPNYLLSQK